MVKFVRCKKGVKIVNGVKRVIKIWCKKGVKLKWCKKGEKSV